MPVPTFARKAATPNRDPLGPGEHAHCTDFVVLASLVSARASGRLSW